jgi:DTW domain-containing protein
MSIDCQVCLRPEAICMCAKVVPLVTRTRVLILQHPAEIDFELGTAGLLKQSLPHCALRPGLSWPSLAAALGEGDAVQRDWAVVWTASLPRPLTEAELTMPAVRMDSHGKHPGAPPTGIVLLDGTWSQAKALWWRNAWLLRLQRIVLHPAHASIYGRLRREPRRTALSTLEAAADALVACGEPVEVHNQLERLMRTMCQRARDRAKPGAPVVHERAD